MTHSKSLFPQISAYLLVAFLMGCAASPAIEDPVMEAPVEPPMESPTSMPTSIPPAIPSDTPLPLPDFKDILEFSLGGGALCSGAQLPHSTVMAGRGDAVVCFRDTLGPLVLEWHAPSGRMFRSRVDTSSLVEHYFRWPLNIPPGQWYVRIFGNGYEERVDFIVSQDDGSSPMIRAVDARSDREINTYFSLALKENGTLDVAGINYPAETPVYILVYRAGPAGYQLIHKQVVRSDMQGSIYAELPSVFQLGESYLLIGITDPQIDLTIDDDNHFDTNLPHDAFVIER
jgi:hypothetical protein